jgi:hypothetical protein
LIVIAMSNFKWRIRAQQDNRKTIEEKEIQAARHPADAI